MVETDKVNDCMICGAPLVYHDTPEMMKCVICGKEFESYAECSAGHFVCDECHASKSVSVIHYICSNTKSKNPIEIAKEIMSSNAIHTHGPEYHVLVADCLIAAFKNSGADLDLAQSLATAEHRGKMVPGGFCGHAGACGAGISAGIFLSTVLKTNPLSEENWALGNGLTGECLIEISKYGGPRCCKRDSFTAIKTAAEFVKEHFGVCMEMPESIKCDFSNQNHECLKERCPYYRK